MKQPLLDSRAIVTDNRAIATDNRAIATDSRAMAIDSRAIARYFKQIGSYIEESTVKQAIVAGLQGPTHFLRKLRCADRFAQSRQAIFQLTYFLLNLLSIRTVGGLIGKEFLTLRDQFSSVRIVFYIKYNGARSAR